MQTSPFKIRTALPLNLLTFPAIMASLYPQPVPKVHTQQQVHPIAIQQAPRNTSTSQAREKSGNESLAQTRKIVLDVTLR